MKKLVAILLIFVMTSAMLPTSAEGEFIFLAINDIFQRNPTPTTIPIKIGNKYYVEPIIFTRVLALKTFYNEQLGQQLVYNTDFFLTFDLTNNITYDDDGKVYNANAVRRNGRIYVPIDVVAQRASYRYSVITSNAMGHIVRISNEETMSPTDTFLEKNATTRLDIYKTYKEKYLSNVKPEPALPDPGTTTETPPDIPPPEVTVTPLPKGKNVYLTFDVTDATFGHRILDALDGYNYRATFFVNEKTPEIAEMVRRAVVEGHFVGVSQSSATSDIVKDIENTNKWIKSITLNKSTIFSAAEGSASLSAEQREAIIAAGYRIWDDNMAAQTTTKAYINRLSKTDKTVVLGMDTTEATAGMLGGILTYIQSEKYTVHAITRMDTPLNSIAEVR